MSGQSTPFKPLLKTNIYVALKGPSPSPPNSAIASAGKYKQDVDAIMSKADAALNQQAEDIANAVENYVNQRLEALALQLKLPSAFIGTSAAGPVTIAPASFAAYDPKTT
jgi:hypothetical protein